MVFANRNIVSGYSAASDPPVNRPERFRGGRIAGVFWAAALLLMYFSRTDALAMGVFTADFSSGVLPSSVHLRQVMREGVGGAVIASPPVEGKAISSSLPPIFAGHRLDEATGMCKTPMRFYAPRIGRFTQSDPLTRLPMPAMQMIVGNPFRNHLEYVARRRIVRSPFSAAHP